jgi:crossover junction endodeoxyribonuclease RuvC
MSKDLHVKQSLGGLWPGEKRQVIDMVRRILKMPQAPKPDDAADALAIAICHARSSTSRLSQGGADLCSTI